MMIDCSLCRLEVSSTRLESMDRSDPGTGNVLHAKTVIQSRIKTRSVTFIKAVLHPKYVLERRSLRQIAAEFASSKTAIRNALLVFNIPLRERWRNPYRIHNLPFGKTLREGTVVDYKREQEIIHSVLKMHGDRLSNTAIARALTAMKIPSKRRQTRWHPEMVRQILIRYSKTGDLAGSQSDGMHTI